MSFDLTVFVARLPTADSIAEALQAKKCSFEGDPPADLDAQVGALPVQLTYRRRSMTLAPEWMGRVELAKPVLDVAPSAPSPSSVARSFDRSNRPACVADNPLHAPRPGDCYMRSR